MSYKVFISHSYLDKLLVKNINSIVSLYDIETYLALMLQIATSKKSRGGSRKLPLVFTERSVCNK
jgi:hypothetical protein